MPIPLPYVPFHLTLTVFATEEGSERVNVFNFKNTGPNAPTSVTLQALAQDFWTNVVAPYYKPITAPAVNFDRVEARDMGIAGGAVGVYFPPQPQTGGGSGEPLPGSATSTMSWRTGYAGRSYRGRNYFIGLTEASNTGSILTSASIIAINTLAAHLLTYAGTVTLPMFLAVASRTHGFITRVISYVLDSAIDSQRRRLANRGR